jgi:murein DD-endopeptidase MepM/ murein hydrolase activator NlpD
MKIYNPIKGYINKLYAQGQVSQWFGENVEMYMAAIKSKGHNGIDIVAPWGTPLYAVEGGVCCEAKTDPSGYGMHVRILTETTEKINREWTYGHLSRIDVKAGDLIKPGQQIGLMGNTGFVVSSINGGGYWVNGSNKYAGTHLHLGCREYKGRTSSWKYMSGERGINVLNYSNGLYGGVDFKDWFYEDSKMGDMEIFKRELEKYGQEDWWMVLIRAFKFFGIK